MNRWAASVALAFVLFLFHSAVFSKSIVDADTQGSASNADFDSKIVSGLDAKWQATPSPFAQQPGGFTLKIGNGRHGHIVFPAVLDSKNPIVIQIQKDKVQQVLASGGSYKAERIGKYLVYQGDNNSILYRYDSDKQSLREFVYLKDASALAKDGDVIQWRFEGVDLKLLGDGSVALTQTIDIKNEVRKVSNNHMAERIGQFLAKRRGTPEKPGSQTRTLFTIPKPEYIDGNGKTLTQGIQYKVADAKLTLHLNPNTKHAYPLWADPSLIFKADADADLILNGEAGAWFGFDVASAGDFNGDGFDDVIVGAFIHDNNGLDSSGSAYIFFGRNTSSQVNLQSHTDADVILNGQDAFDFFGQSVAPVGDFNGDGFADVIVSAIWDSNNGLPESGSAFIFFGRNPASQLILSADAGADVIIDGQDAGDHLGISVDSAGDFNGDGLDDVIVGASVNDNNGTDSGSAFIFFGRSPTTQLKFIADADADIILDGQSLDDHFGFSVSSAGDFNGDGLGDVIVAAREDDNNGRDSGSAFIFFGRNPTGQIRLTADADANIIMDGPSFDADFGDMVNSAGDFNGDGLDDVIVGARLHSNNGNLQSGSAFVFFGRIPTGQIRLLAYDDADVTLLGEDANGLFGQCVSSAGDFNGDGLDDLLVGQLTDSNGQLGTSGSARIFFGRNLPFQILLFGTFHADIIIDGQSEGDQFGSSASTGTGLAPIGDFNGDGLSDMIAGAFGDDNNGFNFGSAFVFFGEDATPPELTILGNTLITIEWGSAYVDAGATALDIVDGDLTSSIIIGGLPINTSILGTNTITYDVADSSGNSAVQATRTVNVVDTISPVVTAPADVTTEATGTTTPVAIGTATAIDNVAVASIINDAPAAFPLGTTVVTWTATDTSGNTGAATQSVTVLDTTLPIVTAPADVTSEATGALTNVIIGTATAIDAVGVASITNNAPVAFPVGTTIVTWTATDTSGNTGTATQNVTVQDTTAPTLNILGSTPVTVEGGTSYTDAGATATDTVDGDLTASIVVGGLPIDTSVLVSYTVTYDVTDASGNSATQATRTVNVVDTTSPAVTPPADVTVDQTGDLTPVTIGTATVTDNIGVASLTNDAPTGDYPVGTTVVTWTAIDTSGNSSSATQQVTVNPVPLVQLQLLKGFLSSLGLSTGLDKKLDKKLDKAESAIVSGNNATAVQELNSFISTVQSNTPGKIAQADADEMIQRAQAIIALL